MKKETLKKIDYYGDADNYIHLKFGDARKMYNFTKQFTKKYPDFVKAYELYWNGESGPFKNALQIVCFVFNNKIPVHFYYNYTDKPAKTRAHITKYFLRENDLKKLYF